MKCPACANYLTPYYASPITLDVCANGCGGIWFDAFELQKMDEVHEPVREELINLRPKKELPETQLTAKRVCPKCEGIVMMRHFYSPLKKVMVDECPNCGGFWLDAGELAGLREENKLEKERKRATQVRLSQISLHAIVSELSAFEGEVGHEPRMTRTLRVMNASVKTLLRTPEE